MLNIRLTPDWWSIESRCTKKTQSILNYMKKDSCILIWPKLTICLSQPLLLLLSHPVMSDFLWSHGLQQTRPEVCPSSCPLHWSCHPYNSSFDALFSFCPKSFSASGTFPMSQLFISGDQNTGVLASASVLPLSIQAWFLLRLTGRENGKPTQYTCRRDLMYCIKRTFAVA